MNQDRARHASAENSAIQLQIRARHSGGVRALKKRREDSMKRGLLCLVNSTTSSSSPPWCTSKKGIPSIVA